MEIIDNEKQKNIAAIVIAKLLVLAGIFLSVYFITLIPDSIDIPVWKFILLSIVAYTPIIAGGVWLKVRKRRSYSNRDLGRPGLGIGIIVIALGVFLLFFSSGLLSQSLGSIIFSWQLLLIILGLSGICSMNFVSGITLLMLGEFFFIPRVADTYPDSIAISENFTSTYWPILLIIFGAALILSLVVKPSCTKSKRCSRKRSNCDDIADQAPTKDGKIDYNLVFTGAEHVMLATEFKGGKISAVFGGIKLDLRKTSLPEGTTYLKVSAVFGGAEIYTPDDWNIEIRSNSVFGGFRDERPRSTTNNDDSRKLVIIAECVFGGGELI